MSIVEVGRPAPTALLDADVQDRDGHKLTLRAVLDGAPALLVFLRHFG